MVQSTYVFGRRWHANAGVALGLGIALVTATPRPTYAGDGGAVAAEVIGGTALGLLGAGAIGGITAAPPPPYGLAPVDVVPPPPYGVEPVDVVPPPPGCHDVLVQSFDPYREAYVEAPRRVCDEY